MSVACGGQLAEGDIEDGNASRGGVVGAWTTLTCGQSDEGEL
jgi:hypothetical protein